MVQKGLEGFLTSQGLRHFGCKMTKELGEDLRFTKVGKSSCRIIVSKRFFSWGTIEEELNRPLN